MKCYWEITDGVTDHERIEAAALGSSTRAIGGRAELVGGALCAQHPQLPIPEVNRALPVEPRVDLDAVHAWFGGRPHVRRSLRPTIPSS